MGENELSDPGAPITGPMLGRDSISRKVIFTAKERAVDSTRPLPFAEKPLRVVIKKEEE